MTGEILRYLVPVGVTTLVLYGIYSMSDIEENIDRKEVDKIKKEWKE